MVGQGRFSPVWRGEIYSHDRIRIDYFSADFRNHPGAQSVVGLFEHHDKSRFEITALSYGPDDGSDLRNRIKSAVENFIDVRTMTNDEIAQFIRRREIDILVDRTGLTQYGRFRVPARRVAPIQVHFLGYPGTIAADWMDYIIADPTIIPEDHFQFYSEQVVWLPDTYQPNDNKRQISERLPTRRRMRTCLKEPLCFVVQQRLQDYARKYSTFGCDCSRRQQNSVLWLTEPVQPLHKTCAGRRKQ